MRVIRGVERAVVGADDVLAQLWVERHLRYAERWLDATANDWVHGISRAVTVRLEQEVFGSLPRVT